MAPSRRLCFRSFQFFRNTFAQNREFSTLRHPQTSKWLHRTCGCAAGGILLYTIIKLNSLDKVYAFKKALKKEEDVVLAREVKLTSRERRFLKFASVKFDGQTYMTPQDFLESFIHQEPNPPRVRRDLSKPELDKIRRATPHLSKGSSQMFRQLKDNGIISYTEYLFLLSILTKPLSGFRIAFNMFDTDGNERVDKNEFLVLQRLFASKRDIDPEEKKLQLSCACAKPAYPLGSESEWTVNIWSQNNTIKYPILKCHQEPLSGFRIAFNMFDTDGNERVDKNEFLVLQRLFASKRDIDPEEKKLMEKIFSHAWKDKRGLGDEGDMLHIRGSATIDYVDDEEGLQRRHNVDTTLTVHFFGPDGKEELRYEGFRKFMDDLQTEVLELEFQEFSHGNKTISEVDFAKILLRYTHLSPEAHESYLERLEGRVKDSMKGITFEEFKVFCQFLNNLDDFTIAMRMYTLADHPISKEEFHRAVMICTGTSLSKHLVQTVFAIFDEDGDGQLSYREFIAIMKDRLHRGFKTSVKTEGWDAFKICVKQEIKTPS